MYLFKCKLILQYKAFCCLYCVVKLAMNKILLSYHANKDTTVTAIALNWTVACLHSHSFYCKEYKWYF